MNNNLFNSNNQMLEQLRYSILKAKTINIIVAFILDSGVKLLIKELNEIIKQNNNIKIKILTGIYLNVTEPNALYRLKDELKDNVEINIYKNFNNSFHPKTYIFEYYNNDGDIIIGSSNISKTALIYGVEWNYKISKKNNQKDFEEILTEFNRLYETESTPLTIDFLRRYHKSWKKTIFSEKTIIDNNIIEPINFQIPALYELNQTREEGYKKAMIIAATGLGKTYLTAFDSLGFNKILFIAHREEILIQSEKSYKKINKTSTGFFIGNKKETEKDIIFASVQTLGKKRYLNEKYFSKTHFDYIIVDEFHHAAANSYKKIIEYFKPKFLLGVTATPYRTDNKDIYKLCDYNIAYECNLKTAINNSWLTPFKYFGLFDDVDYEKISWRSGKYDKTELENALMINKRTQNIIDKYKLYSVGKTVAFCSSINHADYMKKEFNKKNIKSDALHSKISGDRKNIIDKFEFGKTQVLFVVDIFNEGVDIPNIATVLFLRPTLSYTIFIQQLGRGLRLAPNKDYLIVLDFVGNYKGADFKYSFLTGDYDPTKKKILPIDKNYRKELPDNCQANFDFELLNLFKQFQKKEPIIIRLLNDYFRIKKELNKIPTIMDIFELSEFSYSLYRKKFKSYLNLKLETKDLNLLEKEWQNNLIGKFFQELEKTSMSKSYKIPTLLSFILNNKIIKTVTTHKVAKQFKTFYSNSKRYQLDLNNRSNLNWKEWDLKDFERLAVNNPIKFLSSGAMKNFFDYDEKDKTFSLNSELYKLIQKDNIAFTFLFMDILEFKTKDYFRRKF